MDGQASSKRKSGECQIVNLTFEIRAHNHLGRASSIYGILLGSYLTGISTEVETCLINTVS